MNMLPITSITTAALLAIATTSATAADKADAKPAKEKLDVTVSILPHAFLLKAIGGDRVNVTTLVGSGQDPHQFNITPAQTIALSGADAFFTASMPFEEQFIDKIQAGAPDLTVVPINRGITLIESSHDHHHHEHEHEHAEEGEKPVEGKPVGEEEGEHDHDDHHGHHGCGPDPHTWTSPALLGLQAVNVHDTLAELAPQHADDFADNLDTLLDKIFAVDKEIGARLKPFKGREFIVFHPAFGYFARQYDLVEKSIEIEGKKPTPKQLLAIIEEANIAKTKTLFIEPQFDTAVAGEIARQIDAKLVTVDPLTEDILDSLAGFSVALADSFSEKE